MILIPGIESSAFYYWKGSFFSRNLTLCDYEKHLLVVGFETEDDFKELPIIHNETSSLFPLSLVFLSVVFILLSLALVSFVKGHTKIHKYLGCLLIFFSMLLIINHVAFKRPLYSPYKGYQGVAPYQRLIDYVNSRGGFAFWNHPETKSGQARMGTVLRETAPYPYVLSETRDYTGFSALYAEGITITEPGGLWDQILLEFCAGIRENPVWGISAADFHEEGHAGEKLGNFPTVFLVKKRTKDNILEAMKKGRMYAYRGHVDLPRLKLMDFSISDPGSNRTGVMGEEISVTGPPEIHIRISADELQDVNSITVRLIRNGELLQQFSGKNPLETVFHDKSLQAGKKTYYRLDVRDSKERTIISNPVFVKFHSSWPEGY